MAYNGKLGVGLDGVQYYSGYHPFLNIWKIGRSRIEIYANTGPGGSLEAWYADDGPDAARYPWGVYIDSDGELLNPLPADFVRMSRIIHQGPENQGDFTRVGQAWVLKFDGTADDVLISGGTGATRVGNRITWTWNSDDQVVVHFNDVDINDPPQNIRIVRAAFESLLDAGEVLDPDWVDYLTRTSGLIRFMDLMVTNNNLANTRFDRFPSEANVCWNWSGNTPNRACGAGIPITLIPKVARAVQSRPWVVIPQCYGTKQGKVYGITNANPAVVTDYDHEYVNGDSVILRVVDGVSKTATITFNTTTDLVSWTGHKLTAGQRVTFSGGTLPTINGSQMFANDPYYVASDGLTADAFKLSVIRGGAAGDLGGSPSGTITGRHDMNRQRYTVANVTDDTYELQGLDTTSHTAWSSGGYTSQALDLAAITTEVTLLAELMRDEVQPWLPVFFEYGNEHWNSFTFDFFSWLAAQAGDYFANEDGYKMYGFVASHMFKAVRDVFGSERGRWKGVYGTQTVNTNITDRILLGAEHYLATYHPTLGLTDIADYGAITLYSDTLINTHLDMIRQWMDDSEARWIADLEPTKYAYFDRMVNDEIGNSTNTGINSWRVDLPEIWDQTRLVFAAKGLGYTSYEGGNHNDPGPGRANGIWDQMDAEEQERYLEFYTNACRTAADAENHRIAYQAFIDQGGEWPNMYPEIGIVDRFGSFGEVAYIPGDENPLYQVMQEFNLSGEPVRRNIRMTLSS